MAECSFNRVGAFDGWSYVFSVFYFNKCAALLTPIALPVMLPLNTHILPSVTRLLNVCGGMSNFSTRDFGLC